MYFIIAKVYFTSPTTQTSINITVIQFHLGQTGNSTLVRSLVRLPDNHLHFAESERVLCNEDKFEELVDLCHCKGKHRQGTYSVCGM